MDGQNFPIAASGFDGRLTMEGRRFISDTSGPAGPLFAALLAMQARPHRRAESAHRTARRQGDGSR